jgi:Photoprotection regulator fluorescence recovery protein
MSTANGPKATPMRDWTWSPAEKAIAHKTFDLALDKELEAVLREAKARASRASEASDLWKLESWLGKRRREIDNKYDFRYSVLPLVFGGLLREGSISEQDLRGLGEEKLEAIRRIASY